MRHTRGIGILVAVAPDKSDVFDTSSEALIDVGHKGLCALVQPCSTHRPGSCGGELQSVTAWHLGRFLR
jgi:hypothetical protein